MISKKKLVILAVVAILLAPVVLSSKVRRSLITHWPLKAPYLKYSKWRYHWRAPSDLGDGKQATQVIIEGPMGIGEDSQGNIFVADREGKLVWKIDKSGRAVVIAGTGRMTGAGGPPSGPQQALELDLAMPEGLVVDRDDTILLADSYNHLILRINQNGTVTRFAGTGER